MKKLGNILLAILPVAFIACNDGSRQDNQKNQNRDNDRNNMEMDDDVNKTPSSTDTISQGSFFSFRKADQQDDKEFVKEAASSSLMEIELGNAASQNALNPRVKKFGEMMALDHQKASEELKAIASTKDIEVPFEMNDIHKKVIEDVRNEKGDDFDKAYIKAMESAHEKDIDLFEKQSENGSDPSFKEFAAKQLPSLMIHRDSVKAIQKDLR